MTKLLGRQFAQVRQARIAGAEIVDRQVHADQPELRQRGLRRLRVLHRQRFGDFAGQAAGFDAVSRQRGADALRQIGLAQMLC
jgi:hypothetical protein